MGGGKDAGTAVVTPWQNGLEGSTNGAMNGLIMRRDSFDSGGETPLDKLDTPAEKDEIVALISSLSDEEKAHLAALAFDDILSECLQEVAFEAHRDDRRRHSPCQVCHTKCLSYHSKEPGKDIFRLPIGDKNSITEKFQCYKCNSWYPAGRYAPHLEKCLGFGGRAQSRSSSRRPGTDRASSSPLGAESDSDSVATVNEKRGIKRKEPSLRKSLGKKIKTGIILFHWITASHHFLPNLKIVTLFLAADGTHHVTVVSSKQTLHIPKMPA
ncbi:hypothetical protein BC832DRAFT_185319 [Gaertneriomyces semiglobifer]|nr:hypothetical protein BC832DRAFT_185319 [Gaertneriomyces semiglobifer]